MLFQLDNIKTVWFTLRKAFIYLQYYRPKSPVSRDRIGNSIP
jgi:hypothetical protein